MDSSSLLVLVYVKDVCAFYSVKHDRLSTDRVERTDWTVHTARQKCFGFCKYLQRHSERWALFCMLPRKVCRHQDYMQSDFPSETRDCSALCTAVNDTQVYLRCLGPQNDATTTTDLQECRLLIWPTLCLSTTTGGTECTHALRSRGVQAGGSGNGLRDDAATSCLSLPWLCSWEERELAAQKTRMLWRLHGLDYRSFIGECVAHLIMVAMTQDFAA